MFGKAKPDIRDEIIRQQAKQIADLLDRLQEMVGQIHYHQVQAAVSDSERLHVSEEEEDARFAHAEGLIDKKALEDALKELDFHNTDIQIG